MSKTIVRCPNCGHYNENLSHCEKCHYLIDPKEILNLKENKRKKRLIKAIETTNIEARENSIIEQLKNHQWAPIRFIGKIFNFIWLIIMAIGTFIAWLFAAITA